MPGTGSLWKGRLGWWVANWGQQNYSATVSCLPTHVPGFAPHLSLIILASHPSTSYSFPVPSKRKGRKDNGSVVRWIVLIRATLLNCVPLNLWHECCVSRLVVCLGAHGAAPWEGEGCVGLDGGWVGLACSWQENRSPTGVEMGKRDLKLC